MSDWVRLCALSEAPVEGQVTELEVKGVAICLANINGDLRALDNWCPHRRGPLGQGWVEGNAVVCPWHSWAFDTVTGIAEPPERARVDVLPLQIEEDAVMVNIA
jgi:nitrite reductase (NADH) small subunit